MDDARGRRNIAVVREPRLVLACNVAFTWQGETMGGVSQDISKKGIFVRMERVVPVGEVVDLTVHYCANPRSGPPLASDRASRVSFEAQAPDEWVISLRARVIHVLGDSAANALGRLPGIGFAFVDGDDVARERLEAHLEELTPALSIRPEPEPRRTRILLADSSTRLLERLSVALGNAGFVVITVANGAEAYANCLHDPPDVLLAAAEMPVVDGWRLISMLGARPELARIPVALMSDESDDITRLRAYRLGVMDFVPKPFTVAELCIRMRRLARTQAAHQVVLRGNLAEIGVATLLSLLEYERKSGVLTVMRDTDVTWIAVDSGRVVKAEAAPDNSGSLANALTVLGWETGDFEFVACDVFDEDEVGMATTHLILEHARLRDEASCGGQAAAAPEGAPHDAPPRDSIF